MRRARRKPKLRGTVGKTRAGLGKGMAAPRPAPAAAPRPAAAPAAPVTAPPPVSHDPFAVRPGDSASTIEGLGMAGGSYQAALAGYNQQRSQLLSQAGVEEYTDPATGRQFRLNAAGNPYSEAARLGVQHQQRQRGTNTTLGAAGMLFDGATGRAVMADQRAQAEDQTDLLNRVRSGVGQIEQQKQSAFSDAMASIFGLRREDATNAAYNIKPPTLQANQAVARKAAAKSNKKASTAEAKAIAKAKKKARKRGKH